jgi:peptidoglycan/LPS O-acetylase OafA/YrhL
VHGIGYALGFASAGLTYGHQAVILFFLISGFCIHFRQAKATARNEQSSTVPRASLDLRAYGWRRIRRLYPPLVLALMLTALFDAIGSRFNPDYYAGKTAYTWINSAVNGSHSLAALGGNLLFQSGLLAPAFGSNGPLWSLSYEFWFYVLYPILFLVSVRLSARTMMIVAGATSALGLLLIQANWLPYWLVVVPAYWAVWAGGALIAEAYVGRIQLRGLRWLAPIAVIGLLALAALTALRRLGTVNGDFYSPSLDVAWGVGLGILLAYMMLAPSAPVRHLAEKAVRYLWPLGTISYSLYIVHFPWLALISAWWLSWHTRLPLGAELAAAGAVSSLVLAGGCWFLVERHFVSNPAARLSVSSARARGGGVIQESTGLAGSAPSV